MHVRMKTTISGLRDGEPWPARGEVTDLPDDEATHLISTGLAEPLAEAVEAAVAPSEVETAATTDKPRRTRKTPPAEKPADESGPAGPAEG